MAYEIPGFSFPLTAGVDLRTSLFRGVATNATGKAILPAAGAPIIGVCNNKPNVGQATTVVATGISQMEAGDAITLTADGVTPVSVDDTGRAVAAGTGAAVIGFALEAASAAGVIIAVFLTPNAAPAA